MSSFYITLLSDGSSDAVLLRPLAWLLRQNLPPSVTPQMQWADLRSVRVRPSGLAGRIAAAVDLYPCNLLFVHRDAEREKPDLRRDEISRATACSGVNVPVIAVVPVRMMEAWLLFDELAIRRAAGNPNGRFPIVLPAQEIEAIPDPKTVLHRALRSATGFHGRRQHKFNVPRAVQRVGDYVDDYAPLRALAAFQTLEEHLRRTVTTLKFAE